MVGVRGVKRGDFVQLTGWDGKNLGSVPTFPALGPTARKRRLWALLANRQSCSGWGGPLGDQPMSSHAVLFWGRSYTVCEGGQLWQR